MDQFERNLKGNLYRIWTRITSGSYKPPVAMDVSIPKRSGETIMLGIPTISDRSAQTVVEMYLKAELKPCLHLELYSYRLGESTKQAVSKSRERCWKYGWLFEFDIKGALDNIAHSFLLRALEKQTECE